MALSQVEQNETPEQKLARLIESGILIPGCPTCEDAAKHVLEYNSMPVMPRHAAKDSCRSGKHDHCTCDTCF